jgi:hypothetical protein
MRVYLDDTTLFEDLQKTLREARCTWEAVGDGAVEIAHPAALDEREELIELTFFLRAWQAARPEAQIELLS